MENWTDIKGFEGYQVGDLGKIKSLERKAEKWDGERLVSERILKKNVVRGYNYVTLYISGIKKTLIVSRLVALHFVPNPENKPEVNHINGNKLDDRAINLEWTTAKENTAHACKNGLRGDYSGSKNGNSKLTEKQVLEIRKEAASGKSQIEISKMFDVDNSSVSNILRGKTWNHIK